MSAAISVRGVTKRFRRYGVDRPQTLKETALRGFRDVGAHKSFVALEDVSVEIGHGRTVGLIGPNGAGKSTLLRLIGGVGRPDSGEVEVDGRVAALFELGTGFHPELTGRESAMLAGVIAGLTREQVRERLPSVVAFAELDEFIDSPVRAYSSGMQARLAFSLAAHVDPEVFLIDEVLAVGDVAFQRRCIERIREFKRAGVTIVVVSHDPNLVAGLCDEVIWLRGGRVVAQGPPKEVTDRYVRAMAEETRKLTPSDVPTVLTPAGLPLRIHENRFGSQEATVGAVHLLDGWGAACAEVAVGAGVQLAVEVHVPPGAAAGGTNLGVTLVRSDGVVCLDTSTELQLSGGVRRLLRLEIDRLDLGPGDYTFDVGLYDAAWSRTYDFHHRGYPLRIVGPTLSTGTAVLAPPLSWLQVDEP